MNRMEDFKAMSEVELKQKELVIEELEKERKEIEDSIEEMKKKAEIRSG